MEMDFIEVQNFAHIHVNDGDNKKCCFFQTSCTDCSQGNVLDLPRLNRKSKTVETQITKQRRRCCAALCKPAMTPLKPHCNHKTQKHRNWVNFHITWPQTVSILFCIWNLQLVPAGVSGQLCAKVKWLQKAYQVLGMCVKSTMTPSGRVRTTQISGLCAPWCPSGTIASPSQQSRKRGNTWQTNLCVQNFDLHVKITWYADRPRGVRTGLCDLKM